MKGDSGHDVLAVLALGIHHGYRIDHFHGGEIAEVARHGCGSHVDGNAVGMLHPAGSEADHFLVIPYADRYGPLPIPQGIWKLPQGKDVHRQVFQGMLSFKTSADPFKIARGVLKGRRVHFHVVDLYGRVMVYGNIPGGLAHHLFSGSGFLGNKDKDVILDLGHAAKPEPLVPFFRVDELFFLHQPWGHMGRAGSDIVFFKMPFFNANNALPADLFFAAKRFDVHA